MVFDVNMMYNIALFVAHLASVASWQPAPKLWRASQRCARRGLHMNLRDFTDTIKAGGSGGSTALTLDLERENEEVLQRYRTIVDLVNARGEIEVLSDDALRRAVASCARASRRCPATNPRTTRSSSRDSHSCAKQRGGCFHPPVRRAALRRSSRSRRPPAEMATGEPSLAAVAPAYPPPAGHGAHVVTANDYLAQRDADCVGQVHRFLGLSVGLVQSSMGTGSEERKEAYLADIT